MGKHKAPMPRGYDPGGFRFPGRSFAFEVRHPYETERVELRPHQGAILVGSEAGIVVAGAMAVAALVARRRRG